jgi:hypothetical protein
MAQPRLPQSIKGQITNHRSEQNFFSKKTGQENFGSTIGTFDGEAKRTINKFLETSTGKVNVFDKNYLRTTNSFNPHLQTTRGNLVTPQSSRGNAWIGAPKPDESKKLKNLNPLLIHDDNNTSNIIDRRLNEHSLISKQHQTNQMLSSRTQPRFFPKAHPSNSARNDYVGNLLTSTNTHGNQNFRTKNYRNLAMSTNSTQRVPSYDDERPTERIPLDGPNIEEMSHHVGEEVGGRGGLIGRGDRAES